MKPAEANLSQICWVLGMHRSGTSLVSGLLHKSGIVMGTDKNFKPRPNRENPKGFFENYDFRLLNDQILEHSGYIVKDWNPKLKPIQTTWLQRIRMKRLVNANNQQYNYWGWKDPRQMLTNAQWFDTLCQAKVQQRLKIVFVYRNPLNVSVSMLKRKNIGTVSHGLALWFLYNKIALNFIEEKNVPCFTFSFEKLAAHPSSILGSLSEFLEIPITMEIYGQFFSQDLVRSNFQKEQAINTDSIPDSNIVSLFNKLITLEQNCL